MRGKVQRGFLVKILGQLKIPSSYAKNVITMFSFTLFHGKLNCIPRSFFERLRN